jgi:hypothetical protein
MTYLARIARGLFLEQPPVIFPGAAPAADNIRSDGQTGAPDRYPRMHIVLL